MSRKRPSEMKDSALKKKQRSKRLLESSAKRIRLPGQENVTLVARLWLYKSRCQKGRTTGSLVDFGDPQT